MHSTSYARIWLLGAQTDTYFSKNKVKKRKEETQEDSRGPFVFPITHGTHTVTRPCTGAWCAPVGYTVVCVCVCVTADGLALERRDRTGQRERGIVPVGITRDRDPVALAADREDLLPQHVDLRKVVVDRKRPAVRQEQACESSGWGGISGPLSSCRGPRAALKCPYHRDRVIRD